MYANLRGELSKRGIQQTLLAKQLGLHENTINNKLSGKSKFTIEEAFAIKQTFFADDNVDLNYLFATDTGQPNQAS